MTAVIIKAPRVLTNKEYQALAEDIAKRSGKMALGGYSSDIRVSGARLHYFLSGVFVKKLIIISCAVSIVQTRKGNVDGIDECVIREGIAEYDLLQDFVNNIKTETN